MTEGTLTAARLEDDVGEVALGAIFAVREGDFVFRPGPTASRNLSGSLDALLERAQREAARFEEIRSEIPDDRMRFVLSERATERPSITISADQWRVLLAVDGRRDVRGIAATVGFGHLATLGHLHELMAAGLVDAREPAPEEPTRAPAFEAALPSAPAEPTRKPPEPRGAPQAVAEPAPAFSAAPQAPPVVESPPAAPVAEAPPAPSPEDLAAALARRLSAMTGAPPTLEPKPAEPTAAPEAPAPPADDFWASLARQRAAEVQEPPAAPAPPVEAPTVEAPPAPGAPAADERLAALFGGAAPPAVEPAPPQAPPAAPAAAEAAAPTAPEMQVSQYLPPEATAPILETEVPTEVKPEKRGLFGLFRRGGVSVAEAPAAPAVGPASPSARLAAFANALLAEYNSGQYGKARLIERMQVRLRLVDEQAEPIDRALPVAEEHLDVTKIAREEWPPEQVLPYLAHLIRQIYDDARNVFGGDKAKRGYRATIQNALGSDMLLRDRALAEILPKV